MYGNQFRYSPVPTVWELFAKITFAADGVPTLVTSGGNSKGVASISQTDVGEYTLTLSQTFNAFLTMNACFIGDEGAQAPDVVVAAEDVRVAKTINFLTQAGGVNANPGEGEELRLQIVLKNTSAL